MLNQQQNKKILNEDNKNTKYKKNFMTADAQKKII